MRRSVPALAALVLSSLFLHGCGNREPENTAVVDLLPEQIDSWTRSDSADSYNRETIFDYINGAGEVYRSYAFGQVVVVVYAGPQGPDITVELFDMGNPADAYGVFSYAREREETGIGGGYEQKGRVLCFWQDRYYVCVASEERTADSDRALLDISRAISDRLPAASDPPDLVAMLPGEGLVAFSERFFHLHQSLNYQYYLARANILELSTETDAVLATPRQRCPRSGRVTWQKPANHRRSRRRTVPSCHTDAAITSWSWCSMRSRRPRRTICSKRR
jgi:hypothetical protein